MEVPDEEIEPQTHRSRRRLRWVAALCTLLLVVVAGEFFASRAVAKKLHKTVESKLDAKLELGPLLYVPPYGAWMWNSKITRNGQELISFTRLKISLAELPLGGGDKPIIISSLSVTEPVLNLAPERFDDIKKPDEKEKDKPPQKFSDILRLKKVRVINGQVRYLDPAHADAPPTAWRGLNVDVDTIQQSASRYTFHVMSRAAPVAELTAAGTVDVDELLLDVQNSSIKLRTEPDPSRSPLPAEAQEFIRKYRVNGSLSISGSGKIPLREPGQGHFAINAAIQDATAAMSARGPMLDRARGNLSARMLPGGPITIRLEQVDLASAGRQVLISRGQIVLDASAQTWQVLDVEGRVTFPPQNPALASSATATSQPDAPDASPPRGIDKYAIAGKGDFTAAASGPFDLKGKDPWQAIRHEVILYPRDASFLPKNFSRRIADIGGGEVRLNDGMIIFQELSGHCGEDLLRLRSARLPVEGLPKLATWREISGSVVFRRPVGPYTPKLNKVFDALDPQGLFFIAGSYTVDKRDIAEGESSKKTYDLIVSSDNGSFALTDRKFPLERIRGDATVANAGVDLHELQAELLGGTVQATGRWLREEGKSSYEAQMLLRNLDLAQVEDRLRDEPAGKPLEGRIFADAMVGGTIAKHVATHDNLAALCARGEMEIVRGSLFQMPVIRHVTEQIKGLKTAANVGDAAAIFDIENGRVRLRDAAVSSPIVGLQGGGEVHFSGDLSLQVVAAPLADWRERLEKTKIPVVSDVAGAIAGAIQKMLNAATGALLYEFRVTGNVHKIEVIAVPTPILTESASYVFEKMLAPSKKDQRPIDLLRREQAERERQP